MSAPGRRLVRSLLEAALEAVEPAAATERGIRRAGLGGEPCVLFAVGKAARGMALGARRACPILGGIVVAPDAAPMAGLEVMAGAHPTPDARSVAAGERLLRAAREGDAPVLVLLSGGASAMIEAPVEGVSVHDLATLSAALMRAGAPIDELNAVRGALSRIKAGGLARALGARLRGCVVISDVPGMRAELVGSGPCAPLPETRRALEIVRARGCDAALAAPVRRALGAPARAEVAPVPHVVAADGGVALAAMAARAAQDGIALARWPETLAGEARDLGARWASRAREIAGEAAGVMGHGETVVRVCGAGRGGRNQELALAWLLAGGTGTLGTLATDGVDGSSDAAGAIVDEETRTAAAACGIDAHARLADNDSHAFFAATGDALVLGPTGTNVADIVVWIDDARLPAGVASA